MQRLAGRQFKRGVNRSQLKVPIRTVYFAPIKLSMTNKIKEYFEQFGVVEDVRFHNSYDHQYGFVQFKTTEAAKAVLSTRSHRIEYWTFKVKAADAWHQPNPLLTPPHQESNILIALDEDCLREVFQYLNVKSLSNAAEVCICFNGQAKEIFPIKDTRVDLRSCIRKKYGKCGKCENCRGGDWKPLEVESLFRNFGESITALKVDAKILGSVETFVCLANEHCTVQLKVLHLANFEITEIITEQLRPVMASLQNLELFFCKFDGNLQSFIGECVDLKELTIHECDGIDERIDQKFPKLELITVSKNRCNLTSDTVNSFIKLNPTLQDVLISEDGVDTSEIIRAISECLPNLTRLIINSFNSHWNGSTDDFLVLSRLQFLKDLRLDFHLMPIAPLMECLYLNNVPIKLLRITCAEINDDAIDSISKMKKISHLFIGYSTLTNEHLIQLAKKLPNLFQLNLTYLPDLTIDGLKGMLRYANKLYDLSLDSMKITINIDDYKDIVKTIKKRREKLQLSFRLWGAGYINIPKYLLEKNRDICELNKY